ncbi:MAG TPA: hypothetical protein VEZ55_14080 [Chitinophagaceae bacterium]|nr:hypothetical protein [Chitinophagaceae bacterium]
MRLVFIISALVLLASCRSSRNIGSAIAKKDTVDVKQNAPKVDTARLIRSVLNRMESNLVDYNTFSSKIDVDYRGGDNKHYDVNANLRM